jgi:hypothetical protein
MSHFHCGHQKCLMTVVIVEPLGYIAQNVSTQSEVIRRDKAER